MSRLTELIILDAFHSEEPKDILSLSRNETSSLFLLNEVVVRLEELKIPFKLSCSRRSIKVGKITVLFRVPNNHNLRGLDRRILLYDEEGVADKITFSRHKEIK